MGWNEGESGQVYEGNSDGVGGGGPFHVFSCGKEYGNPFMSS